MMTPNALATKLAQDHPDGRLIFTASEIAALQTKVSEDTLIRALILYAQHHSAPVISDFQVGSFVITDQGDYILGVNSEFPRLPLMQTMHAEQSAITIAKMLGASAIQVIHIGHAPCGHCRQILNDLDAGDLRISVLEQKATTLAKLLPHAFGPRDLNVTIGSLGQTYTELTGPSFRRDVVLGQEGQPIAKNWIDQLLDEAREAASRSYVPYTETLDGVALLVGSGDKLTVVSGSSLQNSAYNPSVTAMHAALVLRRARGLQHQPIVAVATVENHAGVADKPSFLLNNLALLDSVGFQGPVYREIYGVSAHQDHELWERVRLLGAGLS